MKRVSYFIFLVLFIIFNAIQNHVNAQHNQWVTPLTLNYQNFYDADPVWDNTNNDKVIGVAYDSDNSTYFSGDYYTGSLSLGGMFTSPFLDDESRGLYIAKVDSLGQPQWLKVLSVGNRNNSDGNSCYSRIYKLDHDSLRDQLWFCFKPCTSGLIDSFPYIYQKNYLGAVSAKTGQVVFLKEVPEIYDFYLSDQFVMALTWQAESEIINGEFFDHGFYLSKVNYSGNIIERIRLVNDNPDPENPPPFPTTGVFIKGVYKAPNGNSIIVGASYDPSLHKHPSIVGTTLIDTTYYSSLFIINVSPTGESNWSKFIYSTTPITSWSGNGIDTYVDDSGSVVITGRSYNDILIDNELHEYSRIPGSLLGNCFIVNIDPEGNTIWSKAFEIINWPTGVSKNSLGEVVFAGTTRNRISIDNNYYVIEDSTMQYPRLFMLKFDTTGNVVNSKLIHGNGFAYNVKSINKDEQLIYGNYRRGVPEDSVFRVGYDAINTRLGGAIFGYFVARTDFNELPEQTRLSSEQLLIYANPNTGECSIRIPQDMYAAPQLYLDIYNESGQIINKAILNFQKEDYQIDIAAHANGIYTARLSNGNKSYYGKIILVK